MSSFQSEEHQHKKSSHPGNFGILHTDSDVNSGNDKDGYIKANQFYYLVYSGRKALFYFLAASLKIFSRFHGLFSCSDKIDTHFAKKCGNMIVGKSSEYLNGIPQKNAWAYA